MSEQRLIKKALMQGKVQISGHTFLRIEKRGYTRSDMINCIMQGEMTRTTMYKKRIAFEIEGFDTDGLPMVLIIGRGKKPAVYKIVTAMPPIQKRFKRII